MTSRSNQRFLRALLRSAASDAATPGAKERARARLREHAGSTWITSRGVAGALVIVLIGTTISSGRLERSSPVPPTDSPSVAAEAPPLAITPNSSPLSCGGGVEAPAASCANAVGGGSGGSSGAMGGSSGGGARGSSGSSSG
ncbi:MAG: hypothetical protein ACLQVI_09185 [Polyangiaceae bacterium]